VRIGVRGRLFLVSLGLIAGSIAAAYVFLSGALDRYLTDRTRDDLFVRLDLIDLEASSAAAPLDDRRAWDALADALGRRAAGRVTVVRADGTVLGDSTLDEAAVARLESHANRPEVIEALARGRGSATRFSTTERLRMMYVAMPFRKDGRVAGVVRLAVPLTEVDEAVARLRRLVSIAALVALAAAVLLSTLAASRLTRAVRLVTDAARRMASGDLATRTRAAGSDEVAELGRALDRLAEELSRLESIRRDFVANASHELRTPVSSVRSAAETLRAGALRDPEAAGRFLEIVERNAERLDRLIADLLDLSRIESRESKLDLEPVEVASVAAHVLGHFRERVERKRIRLEWVPPSGELPRVRADRRALEQVLTNLVDNAVKYCPEAAEIRVRAASDGDRVRVSVEDNGPGIEAKHLPRLFERFYRVDAGRSRELGGTGLGLSIVKHLVEAMGGAVGVESAPGKGSTFSFTLPRA